MLSRIRRIYQEYKDLKHLAYHDSLTGLLNRNWLYKNMDRLNFRFVYFIDVNNLHEINLRGHTTGDEHLKVIAGVIEGSGLTIRYAGDEFLLFSNNPTAIKSNDLFAVGVSPIDNDITKSIRLADMDMIKNKKAFRV